MRIVPADVAYFGPEVLLVGIIPILLLFALNYCINFGIAWIFWKHFKKEGRPSYRTLAAVTGLGLLIDTAAYVLFYELPQNHMLRPVFIGLFVLVGMAATTYWLVFKKEFEQKKAILASLAFGVLSNPVWILVALPFIRH